jgi:hypothetical protein
MIKLIPLILVVAFFTGCGTLIPKKVEFGQDKVQRFPSRKAKEIEVQQQAADALDQYARHLVEQVVRQNAPSNIVEEAKGISILSDKLSDSLGPPEKPSKYSPQRLADKLTTATAHYIERVRDFAEDNNENAGKKIEGTGKIKVPYFVYLGGMILVAILGYVALKIGLGVLKATNPGVSLGLNAIEMGGGAVAKGFSQLVRGGKKFTGRLSKITDDSELREKIIAEFKAAHKESQDEATQQAVKHLTKD